MRVVVIKNENERERKKWGEVSCLFWKYVFHQIFNLKIGDKELSHLLYKTTKFVAINKYRALLYKIKLHSVFGRPLVYKLSSAFLWEMCSYSVEIETY